MRDELEKDKTTQTGPGVPLDKVVDPATERFPEESARVLARLHEHPAAALHTEEHELSEHSYWPIVVAFGLLIVSIGFLTTMVLTAIGAVVVIVAIVGWLWEPWIA